MASAEGPTAGTEMTIFSSPSSYRNYVVGTGTIFMGLAGLISKGRRLTYQIERLKIMPS